MCPRLCHLLHLMLLRHLFIFAATVASAVSSAAQCVAPTAAASVAFIDEAQVVA